MCNGICKRLYKATRLKGHSWYVNNFYCSHCGQFITVDGIVRKKSWRCRCCGHPVRHTPYSGRKAIYNPKKIPKGEIKNVL